MEYQIEGELFINASVNMIFNGQCMKRWVCTDSCLSFNKELEKN